MDQRTNWELPTIDEFKLREWWREIKNLPGTDISREVFFDLYSRAEVVFELPFAIIRLDPLRLGTMAQAHGYFWSRRVLEHLDTFKDIIDFAFRMYDLQYILVVVPPFAHGVEKLITKIGFKWERTSNGDRYYELRRP